MITMQPLLTLIVIAVLLLLTITAMYLFLQSPRDLKIDAPLCRTTQGNLLRSRALHSVITVTVLLLAGGILLQHYREISLLSIVEFCVAAVSGYFLPALTAFMIIFVVLLIEWRGIINYFRVDNYSLAVVERRHPYLPGSKQMAMTLVLTAMFSQLAHAVPLTELGAENGVRIEESAPAPPAPGANPETQTVPVHEAAPSSAAVQVETARDNAQWQCGEIGEGTEGPRWECKKVSQ